MSSLRRRLATYALATIMLSLAVVAVIPPKATQALSGGSFQAGRIMDDGVFFNPTGFSFADVQAFLNSKVPSCDTNGDQMYNGSMTRRQYSATKGYYPPFTCLKNYTTPTVAKSADAYCNGYPATTHSAAEIIYNVAQSCSINPRVLIILLQKEQTLITDDWPWSIQYRSATGYGCPDTAACDSQYYGYFNQVYAAARQFKKYARDPDSYNYLANRNNFILYNPVSSCGGSNIFLQNQATAGLYNYTPYQPNQAALNNLYGTGDSCSAYGNRNFWRMYQDWFGSTFAPFAFKSSSSPTIYLLVGTFKLIVPHMGILQDFGISPQSIQTVSQSVVDSIPSPSQSDGISANLSYLVKSTSDSDSDGGSVYLVSRNAKYAFRSMQQFNDFGFSETSISYLPLGFINSLTGTRSLSNFIQSPYNSVFKVTSGQKQIIFDYPTYIGLNPSDDATPVSYYTAGLVPSGKPLTSREVLVKYATGETVYLFNNNNFYPIPTYDAYRCWGFESTLKTPVYRVPDNSYLPNITPTQTLNCLLNDGSNLTLLSNTNKFSVPGGYNFTPPSTTNSSLLTLASKIPSSTPLKQFIKSNAGSGVWYLEDGERKAVPTYTNFVNLGVTPSTMDVLDSSSFSAIPASGIKLGDGTIVKTNASSAVYVVSGNGRILFSRSDLFEGYRNSWNSIETYDATLLDQLYPYQSVTVSPYLYASSNDTVYIVNKSGCYPLTPALLTSLNLSKTTIMNNQSYPSSIFKSLNLSSCRTGSVYVKSPNSALVYWIDGGERHPVNTWSALVSHSHQSNPYIITLDQFLLDTFPVGTPL